MGRPEQEQRPVLPVRSRLPARNPSGLQHRAAFRLGSSATRTRPVAARLAPAAGEPGSALPVPPPGWVAPVRWQVPALPGLAGVVRERGRLPSVPAEAAQGQALEARRFSPLAPLFASLVSGW